MLRAPPKRLLSTASSQTTSALDPPSPTLAVNSADHERSNLRRVGPSASGSVPPGSRAGAFFAARGASSPGRLVNDLPGVPEPWGEDSTCPGSSSPNMSCNQSEAPSSTSSMRASATAKGSCPDLEAAMSRSVACWAWNATPSTVTVITTANAEKITLTASRRRRPRFSSPLTLGRRM